jgi:uncharacterized protein
VQLSLQVPTTMNAHAMIAAFAPFDELAAALLPALAAGVDQVGDGAHDIAHLLRVWRNARSIAAIEGGAGPVLAAAVLLHDCVQVEKSSPQRAQASRLAAERAGVILGALGWATGQVAEVAHAIAAHSFSAGIGPETAQARVLQDADRLDALGHIGVARCFYTAGRLGSALYDPADPRAAHRALDDRRFATDHFRTKLLHLGAGFQTSTGAAMAAARVQVLQDFLDGLEAEAGA